MLVGRTADMKAGMPLLQTFKTKLGALYAHTTMYIAHTKRNIFKMHTHYLSQSLHLYNFQALFPLDVSQHH